MLLYLLRLRPNCEKCDLIKPGTQLCCIPYIVASNALPVFMLMCLWRTKVMDNEVVEMLTQSVTKVTKFGIPDCMFITSSGCLCTTEHSTNHVPKLSEYNIAISQGKSAGNFLFTSVLEYGMGGSVNFCASYRAVGQCVKNLVFQTEGVWLQCVCKICIMEEMLPKFKKKILHQHYCVKNIYRTAETFTAEKKENTETLCYD